MRGGLARSHPSEGAATAALCFRLFPFLLSASARPPAACERGTSTPLARPHVAAARRRPAAVHPVLFAAYAVLFLWSQNLGEADPADAVVPLLVLVGAALGLTLVFRLIFRDRRRGAIVASPIIVALAMYGHAANLVRPLGIPGAAQQLGWALLVVLALIAVATGFCQSAPPAARTPDTHPVDARLVADASSVRPGETFNAAIVLRMKPDWHVYWKNPGDSGLPVRARFSGPEGAGFGAIRWPLPIAFIQPGEIAGYGYTGEVLLPVEVTVPAEAKPGTPLAISAGARNGYSGST